MDFLIEVLEKNRESDAIVWKDTSYNYKWLLDRVSYWQSKIKSERIKEGTVVTLEADFSPNSVALFLALAECTCIIVPLASFTGAEKGELIKIAQVEVSFAIDRDDNVKITRLSSLANHEYYNKLRQLRHAGLVLFTSGSTGKSKAIVHDLIAILEKFRVPRHRFRTITFLLYDHIGGVNTLLYTLSNGGCLITVQKHSPENVLKAIEKYRVDLLPTTPTFINLTLLSEAYKRYSLNSLKTVTYGTEPMAESTLKRFNELFPHIRLLQTYGLTEVGILHSKSKDSNSLWVKIGGEGFKTRIVDGVLQIKARSAMLGYLNAPSPFTEDGWLNTGDAVETDGEYIKILGRKSEIINVGGKKVYPAEVESVIKEVDNVADVTVYGEKNPIMGNIVCARIGLVNKEEPKTFTLRLKEHCFRRMQNYKTPVKVVIVGEKLHSDRFKKKRRIQ